MSVIDVSVLITGKDANKDAQDVAMVKDRFPDVTQNLGHVKFATEAIKMNTQRASPPKVAKMNAQRTQFLPFLVLAPEARCTRPCCHPSVAKLFT